MIRVATSKLWFLVVAASAIFGLEGSLFSEEGSENLPPVVALVASPDGAQLITGSQAGLEIRGTADRKVLARLTAPMDQVHDLAFSPQGDFLAICGGNAGESGVVALMHWKERAIKRTLRVSDDTAYAVAWSDDGQTLAVACSDRHWTHINTRTWAATRIDGHSKAVFAIAFLPDNAGLVSGGADRSVRWWDVSGESATEGPKRTLNNHTGEVVALATRPTKARFPMIASAGKDGTVRFWQPTIGRLVRFARLPSKPLAIAWSVDGRWLAASCQDGGLRILDPDTARVVFEADAVDAWAYSLAASREGNAFFVGGPAGSVVQVSWKPDVDGLNPSED